MFSTFMFCPCSAPGKLFYNHVRTRETQERNTIQQTGWLNWSQMKLLWNWIDRWSDWFNSHQRGSGFHTNNYNQVKQRILLNNSSGCNHKGSMQVPFVNKTMTKQFSNQPTLNHLIYHATLIPPSQLSYMPRLDGRPLH